VSIYIYSNKNIILFDVNGSNGHMYTSSARQGIRCYVLAHDGRRQHCICVMETSPKEDILPLSRILALLWIFYKNWESCWRHPRS